MTPVRDIVLDHYENPRNIGEMSDADGVGVVENAACGDVMQLYLNIETDTIVEASFKALAKAIRDATELDPRAAASVPSTKGTISG